MKELYSFSVETEQEVEKTEKKKQKNAVKREDKKLIDDWYRSTFDALEIP